MPLTKIEQRTEQWFVARLPRATSSKFGDIMTKIKTGESAARRNYRAEIVVQRLTGMRADGGYISADMQWGIDNEPLARLEYMMRTGNIVEEGGFYVHDTLMAGASPDGEIIGKPRRGGLEVKCPKTATHLETLRTKKVPTIYYWQIVGQMWLCDFQYVDFVSFDPRLPKNAQMIIIRVERDEDAIKLLADEVELFLESVDKEVIFVEEYGRV